MTLRPYQRDALAAVEASFREHDRVLLVVPTGGGKTIMFSHLAQRRKGRVLILAHRKELIDQAAAKLRAATGIVAAIEKAGRHADPAAKVVVASIASLHPERLRRWAPDHFDLVICDEAHHAITDDWLRVLAHFHEHAQVLGVTATPDRGDARNLGCYFDTIAAEVGLLDLIDDGYLARIAVQTVPLDIDLSTVKTVAGDFDDTALATALDPYLARIAQVLADVAAFRRTLVFCPLIATSQKFVSLCRAAGIRAAHVDGESPDRDLILCHFAEGRYDLLSNAMLLTEGYDDPGIDCLTILRPTRSRPLYAQMVGRGTRTAPFKENLLLVDFLWHCQRHRLVRPASLIARDDIEADTMQAIADKAGRGGQSELDLQGIASTAVAQREETLRQRLEANKHKRGMLLDAADWALVHHRPDLADYEGSMKWESLPLTPGQANELKRNQIDPETVRGRGHASRIIGEIVKGRSLTLASPAQRARMSQMGHPNAHNATVQEARRFFAEIRKRR